MGKVQDTINRIARRHRHNAPKAIALIIPTQQTPTAKSFPTQYSEVKQWLATQTSATSQAQLIGLTRALQHSNRLSNSATERLKIVTLLQTRTATVLGPLTQQFIDTEIPHSITAARAFETTVTLLTELAYAYKISLVDVLLRRCSLHRLDRIQAIYFAMRFLGECGLRYSQAYQPWPAKHWRDINTLYWLAEKENAVDETISYATSPDQRFPPTIRRLYATLSLFYLSNNDHLSGTNMERLVAELSSHSELIALQETTTNSSAPTLYSVALNSANAPAPTRFCNYADTDQVRYFDLEPVANALIEGTKTLADELTLSRLQRQKIHHIWTHQRKRQSSRTVSELPVSIQTGIKDCHALHQQHRDLSNTSNSHTPWKLINRNDNGLCLRGNSRDDHRLLIGELITCQIHEPGAKVLLTGIIRWIKMHRQDDLQIGIELLGNNTDAVVCQKLTTQQASPEPRFEALMFDIGTMGFSTAAIALPGQRYRLGDSINIYHSFNSRQASSYKLSELIDYDARFQCFRLTTTSVKQTVEALSAT